MLSAIMVDCNGHIRSTERPVAKMHILFLANASSIHTVRLVEEIGKKGHRVSLVTCSDHFNESLSNCDQYELPFKARWYFGYIANAIHLKLLEKQLKPDVASVHYASGYGTLARLGRLNRVALSVWGSDVFRFPDRSRLHRSLLLANLKSASAVVSTSNVMADRVRELLASPEMRVAITPFGVNPIQFWKEDKRLTHDSSLVLGVIKSLKGIYGHRFLLKALFKVNQILRSTDEPRLKLKIFGSGIELERLKIQTHELGLGDSVEFMGEISNSEVPAALSQLDIFVAPSLEESFGVAVVEAMAAGLPVVVSDAPGLTEVVRHGVDGLVTRRGDSDSLADAILKLAKDRSMRQAFGRSGQLRVRMEYDFSKNIDQLLTVLEATSLECDDN